MTATQIQNMVLALPSDSPYFRLAFRDPSCDWPPSLSKRLAIALSDFSVGWHVASAYAAAGLPLPDFPWPPAVRRAYRLLSEEDYRDDNLVRAHCFSLPDNQVERNLLGAMLVCQGAKYQEIAEVFQCEVEAIQLYEALFCDVRDRGDLLDRAQLLRATGWSGDEPGTFEQRLLHLALETGDATVVLKEAGIRFLNQPEMSVEKLSEQIEQDLITLAVSGLERGLVGKKDNRALALLLRYFLPRRCREHLNGPEPLRGFQMSFDDPCCKPIFDDSLRCIELQMKDMEKADSKPTPSPDERPT